MIEGFLILNVRTGRKGIVGTCA